MDTRLDCRPRRRDICMAIISGGGTGQGADSARFGSVRDLPIPDFWYAGGVMSDIFAEQTPQTLRHVRLDTLVRLRWLAVLGQGAAVLVVYDGFDFEVPFWACLAVITVYASVNVALRLLFRWNQRLEPRQAARLLGLDIIELAVLLFLTGGLQNPV